MKQVSGLPEMIKKVSKQCKRRDALEALRFFGFVGIQAGHSHYGQ